jgi:outer membrane lipoprotein-sorting protein
MKVSSLFFGIPIAAIPVAAIAIAIGGKSGASATVPAARSGVMLDGFDCDFLARMTPQTGVALTLEAVLKKMDAAAANFHALQADFEWDRYEKVIDEVDDVSTGTIYYRRTGKGQDTEMKVDVKQEGDSSKTLKPVPKYVLFRDGKLQVSQADQLNSYDLGKNTSEFESYLVLGFGGSGQDLVKNFDVTLQGPETVDGIATAKLQLVPKSDRVRNNFKEILLWIDLDRGISVKQKFTQPQGDWRLATYSAIQMKQKLGDDIFKLKKSD